jgi:hypothetical protein
MGGTTLAKFLPLVRAGTALPEARGDYMTDADHTDTTRSLYRRVRELHLLLAVAMLSLVSLSSPVDAATGVEAVGYLLVTLVDQDVYLAAPDPDAYPQGGFKEVYLRTAPCSRRSTREPTVLAGDQEQERAWLVFHDGQVCEVMNVSEDRGGL